MDDGAVVADADEGLVAVTLLVVGVRPGRAGAGCLEFQTRPRPRRAPRAGGGHPAVRQEMARELTAAEDGGGMGLTQAEAAAALGVGQATISRDVRDDSDESREPEAGTSSQAKEADSTEWDSFESPELDTEDAEPAAGYENTCPRCARRKRLLMSLTKRLLMSLIPLRAQRISPPRVPIISPPRVPIHPRV